MTSDDQFFIVWNDYRKAPQNLPDLRYPEGIDLDISDGKKSCTAKLNYPALRCGVYVIECKKCGLTVAVTTAGRFDDPRSIKLPCKK